METNLEGNSLKEMYRISCKHENQVIIKRGIGKELRIGVKVKNSNYK